MRKSLKALISLLLPVLAPIGAQSGAWLQPEGNTQAIISYQFLRSTKAFDSYGDKYDSFKFGKGEIAPYVEHGISTDWTIGGALNLQTVASASSGNVVSDLNSYRAAYAEIFARTYVDQGDDFVLAIEPRLKIPLEQNAGINPEGNKAIPELKLAYGKSFEAFGKSGFTDTSATYRYRAYDGLNDMLKFEATAGIRPCADILLLSQAFYDYTIARNQADTTAGNYELLKLQLSAVYEYDEKISFQAGYLRHVDGANTVGGDAFLLSTWLNF